MSSQPPAVPLADRSPTVFVPEIGTAKIIRGDSLWQISRRIYGKGTRYTVIFDANQPQIRNPDLIYPGQIFVLPADGTAAVLQAGVLDLELAAGQRMGDGAVTDFLGGSPAEHPDRYAAASQTRLAPTGVPVLCVHGEADTTVPPEQSRRYAEVDPAAEVALVDGDHMVVIDVAGPAWQITTTWLDRHRTAGPHRPTLGP